MTIELNAYATTFGTGPFHPAISQNGKVHYWPNITFATEQEAYERACHSLMDVLEAANAVCHDWNVYIAN